MRGIRVADTPPLAECEDSARAFCVWDVSLQGSLTGSSLVKKSPEKASSIPTVKKFNPLDSASKQARVEELLRPWWKRKQN